MDNISITPFILLPSKTQDTGNYQYMMEKMTVLPDITFLCLMVMANGHAFEASVFHVLRLSTGIRLMLQSVATGSEVKFLCLPNTLSIHRKKAAFWFLKGIFEN